MVESTTVHVSSLMNGNADGIILKTTVIQLDSSHLKPMSDTIVSDTSSVYDRPRTESTPLSLVSPSEPQPKKRVESNSAPPKIDNVDPVAVIVMNGIVQHARTQTE